MKSACISALLRMLTASAALLSASDSSAQAPAAQADVQRIVVVMDDAYPPYTFRDAEGDLVGILPDQWRLWEASTGVSVELVATNWAAAQAFMKAGRADVIDTIFKTPERMRLYDFGPPYATLEVPVFAHKDLGGIVDAQSLRGFKIGVKAGDAVIERLAADGITGVVEYDGYESLVLAAKHGDVKVFSVDAPPAFYFMTRHGVVQDFNKMFVLYTGNFHRAFAKGDARIMELVQGGFDRLTPRERTYLRAMAELGAGPYRTGDIADRLGTRISTLGPVRASLIKKGMVYSPSHGEMAFTVPLFDEFMRRVIPRFER